MACPEVDELVRLADGLLDPEALAAIERHIDGCVECAEVAAAMAGAATAGDDDAPASWLAPGDQVGRYEIVEWLGAGGMGQVYVADDPQLGRKVALKLVRGDSGDQRLIAEARAMARLSHPNVIAVHDAGSALGRAFIAMELVHGRSLAEWSRGDHGWREVVRVFLAAGRGLAAAHDAGILHRDFKPANVLCGDDGRVLVGDFGLARATEQPDPPATTGNTSPAMALTQSGTVLGTPAYMAPEQFRGKPIDTRADQFSFAVALYQALAGELPFAGRDPEALVEAAEGAELRALPPTATVPSAVLAVVTRGLRARPDDRFPSMNALLDALESAVHRRRRVLASAAAVLVAAGAAATMIAARDTPRTLGALCGDAEAELAAVWNEPRRVSLEAAFSASERPNADEAWQHTRRALDRYAAGYVHRARSACVTTYLAASESPELGARRRACLADRLDAIDALVDNLVQAETLAIDDAVNVASSLPPTSECLGAAVLAELADDPPEAISAEVDAAHDRLRDVRSLIDLERYDDALADAEPLAVELARLGYRPLEAYGLLSLAQIQRSLGKLDDAKESASRALAAAQAAGHSKFSMQAALELAQVDLSLKAPDGDVDRWLEVARANAEKIGDAPSLLAGIARAEGRILYDRGDYPKALEALERELALYREVYGDDSAAVADVLGSVATLQMLLGRHDEAVVGLEQAYHSLRAHLGDSHSKVLRAMINLALSYRKVDRPDDAEALQRRILALSEARFGARSGEVGDASINLALSLKARGENAKAEALLLRARDLNAELRGAQDYSVGAVELNLASVYDNLGRGDDAYASARRGLAIFEQSLPAKHPLRGRALGIVATIAAELGRHDEAREHFARALELQTATLGPKHPSSLKTLRNLGATELELGRRRDGIAHLERAIELASTSEVDDERGLAVARIYLAQALTTTDPGRARRLAREALSALQGDGTELESLRAEASAVLAEVARGR